MSVEYDPINNYYTASTDEQWTLCYCTDPYQEFSGQVIVADFTNEITRSKWPILVFDTEEDMNAKIKDLNLISIDLKAEREAEQEE